MTLRFLGRFSTAPVDPLENDAYFDTTTSEYNYYTGASWTTYIPICVIDNPFLSMVYEGSGAPTDASNAVQLPNLTTGVFWLDGVTGNVYAYIDPTGWSMW